jgi:hypothetical protein
MCKSSDDPSCAIHLINGGLPEELMLEIQVQKSVTLMNVKISDPRGSGMDSAYLCRARGGQDDKVSLQIETKIQ